MLLTLLVIVIYGTVWGWDSETKAETKDEDEDERIRRGTCHVAMWTCNLRHTSRSRVDLLIAEYVSR